MKRLPDSNMAHFIPAQGWTEAGNTSERAGGTAMGRADHGLPPEVLESRCKIYASAHQWYPLLSAADALTDVCPARVSGWLYLAQAQHGLRRTADACETLLAVIERFPEQPEIAYQLARYGSELGWTKEADKWLQQAEAMQAGGNLEKSANAATPLAMVRSNPAASRHASR